MSRSGYSDDCENLNLYRANVHRTISGKRGQTFLQELAKSLDEMPVKELIAGELVTEDGDVCAIGAVCKSRGIDVSKIDYDDPQSVGKAVGITRILAAEIEFMNDEWTDSWKEAPDRRWQRMREWVANNLKQPEAGRPCRTA